MIELLRRIFRLPAACRHYWWPAEPEEMLDGSRYIAYCNKCGKRTDKSYQCQYSEAAKAAWHLNLRKAEELALERLRGLN